MQSEMKVVSILSFILFLILIIVASWISEGASNTPFGYSSGAGIMIFSFVMVFGMFAIFGFWGMCYLFIYIFQDEKKGN